MGIQRFACALALILAGCAPTSEDGFYDSGAGLSLHNQATDGATKNLQNYYRALCLQANPLLGDSAHTGPGCASYDILVRTGFNDIDLRCDRYLAWLDRRRIRNSTFKSGVTATSTLVAGVASGGTIRDVALALGFASSIYDTYNNALLNGLENSTIKKIVYERRRAYRQEFLKIPYTNYADTTYALRGYLRICTPQTIVLSANDYAVAGLTGRPVSSPSESARQEAQALSARAPANTVVRRTTPKRPAACRLFSFQGCEEREVRTAQRALCMNPTGKAGKLTEMALEVFEETDGTDVDGTLSRVEYERLKKFGCKDGDREKGYANYWERTNLGPDALSTFIEVLNENLSDDEKIPADAQLATDPDSAFRRGVGKARDALDMTRPAPFDNSQVTGDLATRMN